MKHHHRWVALLSMFGACPLIACGERADRSPESLVASWLQAAHEGRAEDFRAAYPTRVELESWLDCPPEVDLASRFEAPNPDFTAWRGAVRLASTSAVAREEIATSGPIGGCTARLPLALTRVDATLDAGRVLRLRLVEVEGRFRILGY